MRATVLRTHSLSCNPIYEPLRCLGHEVKDFSYFDVGVAPDHRKLRDSVIASMPDFVVFIGQHDDGKDQVPPIHILKEIATMFPMVHICCDGSETVWWPQLEAYRTAMPSMLNVNIDGVRVGFFEQHGLTTLCPMHAKPFDVHVRPLADRLVRVGFCGGWGVNHPRGDDIEELLRLGYIHAVKRPFNDYDGYRQFLCSCLCVFNHAHTGTADHMHVKARTVETGLARSILLEPEGSPLAEWFVPGVEYLTYSSLEDVMVKSKVIDPYSNRFISMCSNFRLKMIFEHSASAFWPKVLQRII